MNDAHKEAATSPLGTNRRNLCKCFPFICPKKLLQIFIRLQTLMASFLDRLVHFPVFLLLVSCSAVLAFDGKMLSRICNGDLFFKGSNYNEAVTDTLNDLVSHIGDSSVLDYYCRNTRTAEAWYERDATLYGHAVCSSYLSIDDCRNCMNTAASEMFKECTHSVGAQIQLMDCRIRYENYKFNNDG